jgi:5-methylcytosine-specific restriction endonuclease McrA
MTESWTSLTAKVRERARGRCEYCLMSSALQGGEFHIEHVVPSSKGGSDDCENLALACP